MIEDFAKAHLRDKLRGVREALVWKLEALPIDAPGYVPWWDERVMLFNVMAARLCDATRHAGHADILRETIDGSVGVSPETA